MPRREPRSGPGIGDDPDPDREIHADLAGFKIDLDQVGRHGHSPPVSHELGESAADRQHDIGVGYDGSGSGRTSVPERKRVAFVEEALAVERGHHWRAEPGGQGLDGLGCARPECASSRQDDWSLST